MPRKRLALVGMPRLLEETIKLLGRDINIARRRRRISQRSMAERMMCNVETIARLERGEPGVSIGIFVSAVWLLGMHRRLETLFRPVSDTHGLVMDLARLPERPRPEQDDIDMDF